MPGVVVAPEHAVLLELALQSDLRADLAGRPCIRVDIRVCYARTHRPYQLVILAGTDSLGSGSAPYVRG